VLQKLYYKKVAASGKKIMSGSMFDWLSTIFWQQKAKPNTA
jgi:hypothetical protein